MPYSGEVRSLVEVHGMKSIAEDKEGRQYSPALDLFLCTRLLLPRKLHLHVSLLSPCALYRCPPKDQGIRTLGANHSRQCFPFEVSWVGGMLRQRKRFEGQWHIVENRVVFQSKNFMCLGAVKGLITRRVFGSGTQYACFVLM